MTESADQLGLFYGGERYQAWKRFHEENPQVYKLFLKFANEAREAGRERFGARMIWERIRWYTQVETTGWKFKLNNNHVPYYARLLMLRDRRFDGFFDTRDARFDVTNDELKEFVWPV